jgi:hypothetical protein
MFVNKMPTTIFAERKLEEERKWCNSMACVLQKYY